MSTLWGVVHAMKIFLASPHTITRFKGGTQELMRIFMAGGISGNLNPLWKMIAHGKSQEDAISSFLGRGRESELGSTPDG